MTESLATRTEFRRICISAIVVGLIVSLWQAANNPVVNDDGVLYLSMAEAMAEGNWEHVSRLFSKPFYPALIALTQLILSGSFVTAAHIVNAMLSAVLIFAFLYTIYNLGASSRLLIISASLVVLSPSLIKYQHMIIRDHGYITFLVMAIGSLFLYGKMKKKRFLVAAAVSIIAAGLFRYEAVLFLASLPFIVYVSNTDKKISIYKLGTFVGIIVIGGLAGIYFWQLGTGDIRSIGYLSHIYDVKHAFLQSKTRIISEMVLGKYNADSATLFFISGLMAILAASIIHRVTVPLAALAIYGFNKSPQFRINYIRRTWILFAIISLLALVALLMMHHIVVSRYALALVCLSLFPAAYGLDYLFDKPGNMKTGVRNGIIIFIGLFLVLSTVQRLYKNNSEPHIVEAALWISDNVSDSAVIMGNNSPLLYHAGHSALDSDRTGTVPNASRHLPWLKGLKPEYLALEGKYGSSVIDEIANKFPNRTMLKEFRHKNNVVLIYKVNK